MVLDDDKESKEQLWRGNFLASVFVIVQKEKMFLVAISKPRVRFGDVLTILCGASSLDVIGLISTWNLPDAILPLLTPYYARSATQA